AVLNDLEIGAGPGGLGAEEHGDLPVGRVTMIMGGFPGISRGQSLNTWHHVKRANTVAAPSRKDLRQESPDYCQKPARTGSISAFQLGQQFGSFGLRSGFSHDFAPLHRLTLAFGHACRTIR